VSESGGQQKRTLRASWDIQLGAKLRSAAKCGAYYQARWLLLTRIYRAECIYWAARIYRVKETPEGGWRRLS